MSIYPSRPYVICCAGTAPCCTDTLICCGELLGRHCRDSAIQTLRRSAPTSHSATCCVPTKYDRKCGVCREEKNPRGMWKCIKCGTVKSKTHEFTKWLAPNPKRKKMRTHVAMLALRRKPTRKRQLGKNPYGVLSSARERLRSVENEGNWVDLVIKCPGLGVSHPSLVEGP